MSVCLGLGHECSAHDTVLKITHVEVEYHGDSIVNGCCGEGGYVTDGHDSVVVVVLGEIRSIKRV